MNIALLGSNSLQFNMVYSEDVLKKLSEFGTISPMIKKKDLEKNRDFLKSCEFAFATWGMPKLTQQEIKKYFPNLKAVFYSAGTVQYFAKPFLDCGIKIFSAASINAIPVAEYTYSQICLASKGYFQSAKKYKLFPLISLLHANKSNGNYKVKIGLVGLGSIGSLVAEKLQSIDAEVYAYDPFVLKEKADSLNVKLVSLEELFKQCDIISNHLANKKELKNIFNYSLFKNMKKHSTFINTGRGAQVDEYALALNLILHPSKTAVIDVLKSEYFPFISPLYWCHNAIITPHIAGSIGKEPQRMAEFMIEEFSRYLNNEPAKSEVTMEALKNMA